MISIKTFLYYCLLGLIGLCSVALATTLMAAIMFSLMWLCDKVEDLLS